MAGSEDRAELADGEVKVVRHGAEWQVAALIESGLAIDADRAAVGGFGKGFHLMETADALHIGARSVFGQHRARSAGIARHVDPLVLQPDDEEAGAVLVRLAVVVPGACGGNRLFAVAHGA